MFGHYLPNKNEGATVVPKSKIRELNKGLTVDRMGEERGPVRDRLHPSIAHRRMMRERSVVRRPAGRPAGAFTRVGASACMRADARGGGGGVPSPSNPACLRASQQLACMHYCASRSSSERALHAEGRRKQQAAWKRGLVTRQARPTHMQAGAGRRSTQAHAGW